MILRAKQICLGLVILFMGMSTFLIWPRLQYQSGMAALQTRRYGKAVGYFSRSLSWLSLPVISLGTGLDRFRVSLELGKTQYLQAVGQWREQGLTPEVLDLLKKAQHHLGTALEDEPEDYNTAYWLAQAEAAMETGFSRMHPGTANPHDASEYFKKAMALRPAGISVRFLYARYLYREGRISAIPPLVKEMVAVSPSSYWDMRSERFFNQVYYDDVEAGLLLALEKRFVRQDAWRALSRLYWDMGKLDRAGEAFEHYRTEKEELSGEDLVHLGSLMIASEDKEEGFAWFDEAISDPDKSDAAANAIYDALDKAGQFDVFLEYSFHARDEGLVSNALDLNAAKGMIKQGLLPFARARLVQINARKADPEAYALLARISEQEQDWKQAVDMARDGLKLAPGNAKLHYLLSKAHEGAGALDLARQAAAKAVQLNPGNRGYKRQEQKFVHPGD